MGVEQSDTFGLNIKDTMLLVKGHVLNHYQFNPASPIDDKSEGYNRDPKLKDRMHCIVYVMDATLVAEDNVPAELIRKIRDLQFELKFEDIPRIVLLTKIDCVCDEVKTDITKTYESESLKTVIDMTSELFMLPERNIFPIQNYTNEVESNKLKEILALLALRQMVRFATDRLNQLNDFSSDDEEPESD